MAEEQEQAAAAFSEDIPLACTHTNTGVPVPPHTGTARSIVIMVVCSLTCGAPMPTCQVHCRFLAGQTAAVQARVLQEAVAEM